MFPRDQAPLSELPYPRPQEASAPPLHPTEQDMVDYFTLPVCQLLSGRENETRPRRGRDGGRGRGREVATRHNAARQARDGRNYTNENMFKAFLGDSTPPPDPRAQLAFGTKTQQNK